MHRLSTRKAKRAFTLVELLVVVLILAILMAVALPLYLGAIRNSEKGAARANMQTIANANVSYRLQNSQYAPNINALYGANTDLGPNGITGPSNNGVARTYSLLDPGQSCDHDGDGAGGTANVPVPANSFGVSSSVTEDGCFIPGVSPR